MTSVIVDGKKIAIDINNSIRLELKDLPRLTLAVLVVGNNPISLRYIKAKKKLGESLGVDVRVYEYEDSITEDELREEVIRLVEDSMIDGLIVQLPLPQHIAADVIFTDIDPAKDPDALSAESLVDSPVVGAIKEIFKRHNIEVAGCRVVVIGAGRLVGRPAALYLTEVGGRVEQFIEGENQALLKALPEADIIVTGAGVPGLIKPEYLKEGVVLIDAATSEAAGKLCGDADPACASKCSIFTPVPGGVGPMTMAVLFRNLLILRQRRNRKNLAF